MTTEALTRRFNMMISKEQYATLDAASKASGAPIAELVRRAVEKDYPSSPSTNQRTNGSPDVQDES